MKESCPPIKQLFFHKNSRQPASFCFQTTSDMGGKSRDLFGLGFWMDSSKIDHFRDIMAGKQEMPKDRIEIIKSLANAALKPENLEK